MLHTPSEPSCVFSRQRSTRHVVSALTLCRAGPRASGCASGAARADGPRARRRREEDPRDHDHGPQGAAPPAGSVRCVLCLRVAVVVVVAHTGSVCLRTVVVVVDSA